MRRKGFITIGYGNLNLTEFVERIKKIRVNCIVDVRTKPYSKYNMGFNKEELRDRLNDEKISYFWLGNKLGGRYDKIKYCDLLGRVDYEKVATSEKFKEGIKELTELFHRYNVCVMCSELDPLRCHRFFLISRALKEYNIYHIMPDGKLISNMGLEKKLLNKYGDCNQISLFDDENSKSLEEIAYREQGLKISYTSEKVKNLLAQGVVEDPPEKINIFCIGCEGKTAEEFFKLLSDYKVKRIVDIRTNNNEGESFARYPDIAYYLKLHCISYEQIPELLPPYEFVNNNGQNLSNVVIKKYAQHINQDKGVLSLLSDELDGTCFLGNDKDYKKCYRSVIIKELKNQNKNIVVRHLK